MLQNIYGKLPERDVAWKILVHLEGKCILADNLGSYLYTMKITWRDSGALAHDLCEGFHDTVAMALT